MIVAFWLLALVTVSTALECTQIPEPIIAGEFVTIPAGANDTVQIPPNFSCTYNVSYWFLLSCSVVNAPPMIYAHVTLENGLNGNNDMITVIDEQLTRTIVSSRSAKFVHFYIFPNTTTKFQVITKSVNMHSSFRIVVHFERMLNTTVTHLGNPDMKYFMLNDLRVNSYRTPQTMISNERISLSIAHSGWYSDIFDNYFVIEGYIENPKAVYRMSKFVYQGYISTGNILTVVGLDNRVSESSVTFVPLSQAQQYDSYTAFSTYFQANQLDMDSTVGDKKKKAVTVISMEDIVLVIDVQKVRKLNTLD
nr:protein C17H12.8 [imported] - Caenorhabditis elegans [Caenorhabditis elegans]